MSISKTRISCSIFSIAIAFSFLTCAQTDDSNTSGSIFYTNKNTLTPQAVSGANPLKGLYPSSGFYNTLPHSMEHLYFPFEQIMTSPDTVDFSAIDSKIQAITKRGHHTVLRIYLDYPDKSEEENGTPQWIYDMGIEKHTYERVTNGRTVYGTYPDYSDSRLIDILINFINALAQKYDNDPRLGFMECGLIGHWGEWHTTNNIAMPSSQQKIQLLTAYTQNFKNLKLLLRYPDDSGSKDFTSIGFHDDSFTYSTLGEKNWFFYPKMTAAQTTDRYKTAPIGGEMYPSNQQDFVNNTTENLKQYQSFEECARTTRISFMKCSKAFNSTTWNLLTEAQKTRLAELSDMTGYNLTVKSSEVKLSPDLLDLKVQIQNTGLSRFYYNWNVKIIILQNNQIIESINTDWDITSIKPDTTASEFTLKHKINLPEPLNKDSIKIALKVENPLTTGTTFKFANKEMNLTKGWIVINN